MSMLADWQIRQLCVKELWDSYKLTAFKDALEYHSIGDVEFPMIEPFTEAVSGNDVISYGLSHYGYDLRLSNEFRVYKNTYGEHINPKHFKVPGYLERVTDKIVVDESHHCFILPPHGSVLARSVEYLRIPPYIQAFCIGKSTYARCCTICNVTPAEPGWQGYLTIEISNFERAPVDLFINEGILQMVFFKGDALPEKTYKGKKYDKQTEVTPPRVL